MMLTAMEDGYAQAKEAFGGFLPEISRQTVELASENLSEWAAGEKPPQTSEASVNA